MTKKTPNLNLNRQEPKESCYSLDEVIIRLSNVKDSKQWETVEIILCLANEIKRLNNLLESHGIYE